MTSPKLGSVINYLCDLRQVSWLYPSYFNGIYGNQVE
jgi:hypothetical protein